MKVAKTVALREQPALEGRAAVDFQACEKIAGDEVGQRLQPFRSKCVETLLATSRVVITGSDGNNEILGSDFNDWLNGGKGVDTVRGGFGSDVVNGGLGKDTLFGDDGKDAFVFNTALSSSNVDHFGDFRPVDDSIRLDDAVFQWTGQALGALKQNEFKVIGNGQTVDADDHIIYNQTTGGVFYDVDGAGGQAAVLFAVADNFSGDVPILTFQDFFII